MSQDFADAHNYASIEEATDAATGIAVAQGHQLTGWTDDAANQRRVAACQRCRQLVFVLRKALALQGYAIEGGALQVRCPGPTGHTP